MAMRLLSLVLALVLAGSGRAAELAVQRSGSAPAAFEVISIKVNKSGEAGFRGGTKGRAYTVVNMPLRYVVAAAYSIPVARVVGGPTWLGAPGVDLRFTGGDRFDISATLPESASASQVPAMLRAML